jgi:hypothetical protein
MSILKSGIVGNIQYNQQKQLKEEILNRWSSLGILDGLKGPIKENIAVLYENQAKTLITENTGADNSGSFETVAFPIVRRVYSKLLVNDIASVQALTMPIGRLYYYVPLVSSRVNASGDPGDPHVDPQYSAHTGLADGQLPDCVVEGAGCSLTQFQKKNLYDIFYNDGLFDHSKGAITIQTGAVSIVKITAGGEFTVEADASTAPLATDGTLRHLMIAVSGFTSAGAGRLTGPDGNVMDTESFLASLKVVNGGTDLVDPDGNVVVAANAEIPFRVVTQKYGKGIVQYGDVCDANGIIYLELDLTHPAAANGTETYDGYIGLDFSAHSGMTGADFIASWAEYGTLEFETEIGEVSFTLDFVTVSVEERKLRATWSPEQAQDVAAFHNIDAEAELTATLSEQIAAEIDREVLRDLRKAAAWQLRWDYNGWRKASNAASPYTQKEWNQTLITVINQLSAQIHKTTLRGGANFIVVSSEVSAIFNDLEYFHASDASPEQDVYNMGIERIGTFQGRYQVYRDPYAPSWSVIVGHKGRSLLDTGYIYAPYVPMQLTQTLSNPFNFANVKGIMTRYAKKVVNNRYYGHVRVDGVPTFNVAELR